MARASTQNADGLDALTNQELQVVRRVAEHLTAFAIAKELGIGSRIVESHRVNALKKLGISSSAQLKNYMRERNLVTNDALRGRTNSGSWV